MGLDYGASSDLIAEDNKRTLAELEAILYGNLINGDASMGLDYGASSDLIAEDNKRRLEALELAVTIQSAVTPQPTDILFGNSAITNVDGTRELDNVSGNNVKLNSGQARWLNGVDQSVQTDFQFDYNVKKWTVIWTQEVTANTGLSGSSNGANRFYYGLGVTTVKFGIFDSVYNVPHNASIGDILSYALTFDLNNLVARCYINGMYSADVAIVPSPIVELPKLTIGRRDAYYFVSGIIKDNYIIPELLSDDQIKAHFDKPETTLYWDNSTLKSDKLQQSTIDAMLAGGGLYYSLGENEFARQYVKDGLSELVNRIPNADFSSPAIVFGSKWTRNTDGSASGNVAPDSGGFANGGSIILSAFIEQSKDYLIVINTSAYTVGRLGIVSDQYINVVPEGLGIFSAAFTSLAALSKLEIGASGLLGFVGTVSNIYLYEVVESGLKPIVNWTAPTTSNAKELPYGTQSLLMQSNRVGVQTGLGKAGELYFNKDSYVTETSPTVLTGDWELDIFVDSSVGVASTVNFRALEIELSLLGVSSGTIELMARKIGGVDVVGTLVQDLNIDKAVITLVMYSNTLMVYVNNDRRNNMIYPDIDRATITHIGKRWIASSRTDAVLGSMTVYDTTRSELQRAYNVSELMLKHGV